MVRVRHSRQGSGEWAVRLATATLLVTLAAGCKSGSWGAKPSWWSFGGTPPTSALTAAPSFDKDVPKPSEAAKPYPTTSTPEGYALSDATKTEAAGQPGGGPPGLVEASSVTYGAAPPTSVQSPPTPAAAAAQASVATQVGRYTGIESQSNTPPAPGAIDPAAAATAGLAAAPAFGEAQAPGAGTAPAAARFADARASESWAATPPPVAGGAPQASGDSRYGQAGGSRFGAPVSFDPPPAAPLEPAPAVAAPPPAAVQPAAVPSPPLGSPSLPGNISPPNRRNDPGYRPGGTSSYRPSRTILAGDEPSAGGVTPVSFEAPPTSP